jgi:hypothetical protein
MGACGSQKLIQCDAGASMGQVDGPCVMKRQVSKEVVNPQRQPLRILVLKSVPSRLLHSVSSDHFQVNVHF